MERGATPEQHAQAGRAGGEATASSHGRDFYEEIGRKGGQARWNSGASAHHHEAAGHHEAAAHHHRQAAYHHSRGEDDAAQYHAQHGHSHSERAHNLSRNALGQFTSNGAGRN